jgi:hypothetical protein
VDQHVVANYVEPTQHWQDHAAPVVRDPFDIISDGKPREATLSLRLVKDAGSGAARRRDRPPARPAVGRGTVTLGPRFCELEDGDWIHWTSARRFGGATKTFRVEAYSIDEKWQNTSRCGRSLPMCSATRECSSPTMRSRPTPRRRRTSARPDSGNWALAAVTLTNGGIERSGAGDHRLGEDDGSVGAIIVEYWKSDGVIDPIATPDTPAWMMEGSHPPSTTKVDITSIEGGAVYYVAISYVVSGISRRQACSGPGDGRLSGCAGDRRRQGRHRCFV